MNDETPGLTAEMLAEAAAEGVEVNDAYQITTVIPYSEKPPEVRTYTKPPQDLDEFFHDYHMTGEIVVDVRPATE
jgi:hypothetical protein